MDWTLIVIALAAVSVWVAAVALGLNAIRVLAAILFVIAAGALCETVGLLLASHDDPHGFGYFLAFGVFVSSVVLAVCGWAGTVGA